MMCPRYLAKWLYQLCDQILTALTPLKNGYMAERDSSKKTTIEGNVCNADKTEQPEHASTEASSWLGCSFTPCGEGLRIQADKTRCPCFSSLCLCSAGHKVGQGALHHTTFPAKERDEVFLSCRPWLGVQGLIVAMVLGLGPRVEECEGVGRWGVEGVITGRSVHSHSWEGYGSIIVCCLQAKQSLSPLDQQCLFSSNHRHRACWLQIVSSEEEKLGRS